MYHKLYLAGILALTALPASAIPFTVTQVWNFSGVCADCPGTGTGVLTVGQSSPTSPLQFAFSYSSPWISYELTSATLYIAGQPFSGTSWNGPVGLNISLAQTVPITSFGGQGNPLGTPGVYNDGLVYMNTFADRRWSTGSNAFINDFGGPTTGTWTQGSLPNTGTPEPSSMALIGLAGVGAYAARRLKLQRS